VPGFIRFTADDYLTAAMACRREAEYCRKEAEQHQSPTIVKLFNEARQRNLEVAEKCELAARVL